MYEDAAAGPLERNRQKLPCFSPRQQWALLGLLTGKALSCGQRNRAAPHPHIHTALT